MTTCSAASARPGAGVFGLDRGFGLGKRFPVERDGPLDLRQPHRLVRAGSPVPGGPGPGRCGPRRGPRSAAIRARSTSSRDAISASRNACRRETSSCSTARWRSSLASSSARSRATSLVSTTRRASISSSRRVRSKATLSVSTCCCWAIRAVSVACRAAISAVAMARAAADIAFPGPFLVLDPLEFEMRLARDPRRLHRPFGRDRGPPRSPGCG